MAIAQNLELRHSQNLIMTPQLRQAIAMLQMSGMELGEFVAAEVEKNPFLETSDPETEIETKDRDGEASSSEKGDENSAEDANVFEDGGGDEAWGEDSSGWNSLSHSGSGGSFDSGDDFSAAENVEAKGSLRDHVIGQINVDFHDPAERMVAAALLDLLDDAGYLPADLNLARSQMGASPEMLERVIAGLQRMDPPGIFARSLRECLEIQLRDKNRLDPAMKIVLSHLDLVAKREKAVLARLCGLGIEDVSEMISEIQALDPRPATSFGTETAATLTPDIFLRPQAGGGWHIELNSDNLPRVLVNERYYATIHRSGAKLDKREKEYLGERWQNANWLVKSLRQRAETIVKIAVEIVRRQDAFFVHGVQHLKPMVLRDIAEAVEMHESTVSRVTQNKTIATPRGMFDLKYFFTNALPTAGGEGYEITSTAVKDRIKDLIAAENSSAALSDDALADILRREGIDVARRTVAKYREALRIPTSAQRKRRSKER